MTHRERERGKVTKFALALHAFASIPKVREHLLHLVQGKLPFSAESCRNRQFLVGSFKMCVSMLSQMPLCLTMLCITDSQCSTTNMLSGVVVSDPLPNLSLKEGINHVALAECGSSLSKTFVLASNCGMADVLEVNPNGLYHSLILEFQYTSPLV